ncbi:DUF6731 family protein [Cetobacterium sp.]|uniref:DUF6731 family protein n=1 Tax=Cetobacterium sp. TaxID=2071632 RepID=UPI003F2E5560
MSRNIRVYKPVIKFNNRVVGVDFGLILQVILMNNRKNNLRRINGYPTLLNFYDNFNSAQFFGGSLWKYREKYRPYTGELDDFNIEQITGTLVETTNFVYDRELNLICFEFNREGSSEADLKRYLNSFLPEEYSIEFNKIYNETTLTNVLMSNRVRSLEIKFDLNSQDENLFRDAFRENQHPFFGIFRGVVNSCHGTGEDLGANFAYWKFDLGRAQGTFNLDTFRVVAEGLNLESEKIAAVKVKFDEGNGTLKEYDLKSIGKHYTFKILENDMDQNPSSQRVTNELFTTYNNAHRMGFVGYPNVGRDGEEHDFNLENISRVPVGDFRIELNAV